MLNSITVLAIYPSQISQFNYFSNLMAHHLAFVTRTKPISNFKQRDYLAMAIGYKGYTDLLKAADFNTNGDNGQPLEIFTTDEYMTALSNILSQKLPTIPDEEIFATCKALAISHHDSYDLEGVINSAMRDAYILPSSPVDMLDDFSSKPIGAKAD